jgi:hypothetical protein
MNAKATNNKKPKSQFHKLAACVGKISIFGATFALCSVIFARITPTPEIPVVSSKLENFSEKKDEYNTIFIGSSRIYRHIVPSKFDNLMQSRGRNIKSYNFGVYAMHVPETYFLLKKILAMKPKSLEFVFIELYDINLNLARDNLRTNRVIYWHTWAHTLWLYDLILDSDRPLLRKLNLLRLHTIPLAYNLANVGKGDRLIQSILNPADSENTTFDPGRNRVFQNPGLDGYLSIDEETDIVFKNRRQDFLANLDIYRQKVESIPVPVDQVETLKPYQLEVIKELIQLVKDSGATPIFVITPVLEKEAHLLAANTKGDVPILFSFNDPIEYPSLYDPELRFDIAHLKDRGAQEFTKLLSEKFSEYLDREKN